MDIFINLERERISRSGGKRDARICYIFLPFWLVDMQFYSGDCSISISVSVSNRVAAQNGFSTGLRCALSILVTVHTFETVGLKLVTQFTCNSISVLLPFTISQCGYV